MYGLVFLALTFSELSAVPPIPRTVLFPESRENDDGACKRFRGELPKGSLNLIWKNGNDFTDEGILVHSLPSSYRKSFYYYKYGMIHTKIMGDNIYYPKCERTYYDAAQQTTCFIWSGTRDPQGLDRVFYEFSPKMCASKVVARGYDYLTFNERGRPIAGFKDREGGVREYWINTTDRGWILFQSECEKEDFSPWFVYNTDQGELYYATVTPVFPSFFSINLGTGESKSVLAGVPQEGGTYYPQLSFRFYGGKLGYYYYEKGGKRYWRGTSPFNYIYKDLDDRLSAYFRGQDLYIADLYCSEDTWSFTVMLERETPLHGVYMLATRTLSFSNEITLERTALRQFQDRLSKKIYRECLIPSPGAITVCDEMDGFVQASPPSSLMVPYFLSLPAGRQAPYPAVMYVHGGPSLHDMFGYEAEVQHLADRGYAVVQVNYRGSTSHPHLYEEGTREWGQGMQRDLSYVADALIQEGIIDPDAVAIIGHSYGGYASLLGATVGERFHTEHFKGYKCAIAECPPSDLGLLLRDFQRELGGIPSPIMLRGLVSICSGWRISKQDEAKLKYFSPLENAAHLSIPLLLMHGREDLRVPLHHSDLFSEALAQSGREHVYVVFEDEAHGWEKPGNKRGAAYIKEEFLARYLGRGEVEPPDIMDVAYTDMTFMKGGDTFPEMEALLRHYKGWGYLKLVPEVEKLLRNLARREIMSFEGLSASSASTSIVSYQDPKMFLWRIFVRTFQAHRWMYRQMGPMNKRSW